MAGLSEQDIPPSAVIVILGLVALPTARRIQDCLPGAEIHGLSKRMMGSGAGVVQGVDHTFVDLASHLQNLYRSGRPIIGLCAAGILIRCLAACIGASATDATDAADAAGATNRLDTSGANDSPDASNVKAMTKATFAANIVSVGKCIEPPLLAVAMDGSAVVPLLGGLAGVNIMARKIAAALAVSPAITTTGELRFGTCLLDPPEGYRLADIDVGKRFVSDLLAGKTTRVESATEVAWLNEIDLPKAADATLRIRISVEQATDAHTLLIHPRAILVAFAIPGIQGATAALLDADTIVTHVNETLAQRGLAPLALAALVLDAKHIGDDAAQEAATRLNVPVRFVNAVSTAGAVNTASTDRRANAHGNADGTSSGNADGTPSRYADENRNGGDAIDTSNAHGLLAAACAQVWPDSTRGAPQLGPSHTTAPTIALTILPTPLQSEEWVLLGRKRGSLSVVGIGPGDKALLAPAAQQALANADDILGYTTYTDMAGPYTPRQVVHGTDNREEMQRARHAFTLANTGRDVVMVSSGDPGVFAMASAVMEALDEAHQAAAGAHALAVDADSHATVDASSTQAQDTASNWSSVQLRIVPGISAAMATAAVAGAPLGHDFCVLSLSDNLKPWAVIESRLRLAAQADLVIALYNPVSKARPWQLGRALEILRTERDGNCLVMLGRDIGRPGARLQTVPLHAVQSDMVDMRTMLIVGSSTTRQFTTRDGKPWVYTPRWYPAATH